MDDIQTRDYFDQFTPGFHPDRFRFALEFLGGHAKPDDRLIDIGCGDGMNLALIREHTPVEDLCGLDVSARYLERVEETLGCRTEWGSIVDPETIAPLEGTFDWVVMGAVLHHLIHRTRRGSRAAAHQAMQHALALLRPGGHLLLFEPTFRPRPLLFGVFWIKRMLGSLTRERVEFGARWANLGQPVVSYYSRDEVARMIGERGEIEAEHVVDHTRLLGALERTGIGLVVRRR